MELGVGATIQVAGRDDVVAGLGEIDDRVEDTAGARGHAQAAKLWPSFEQGNPLFQHVGRRVHEPGIDIAQLSQSEEIGRMLGALENVGTGAIDGHAASESCRVGLSTAVQAKSLELHDIAIFNKEQVLGPGTALLRRPSEPLDHHAALIEKLIRCTSYELKPILEVDSREKRPGMAITVGPSLSFGLELSWGRPSRAPRI